MRSYDVVVAGLGPVGAVLAARLGALGADVLVVEPSLDVHPLPRAVAADDEVHELLERTAPGALAGAVLDVPVRFVGTSSLLGELRFPTGAGGRPGLSLFDQPTLERRLRAAVAGEVRLGVGVAGLAQDGSGVSVRLTDGAVVRGRWLVGCDGASSAVRRLSGTGFPGRDLRRWLVVDVAGDVPTTGFTYSCDPAGPMVDMPLPGGHRWERLLDDDEAPVRVPLPDGVEVLREVVYRYGARRATRWRTGRVLLAGDAAHVMPPFAGQGLGAGVRDAWALAALLARDEVERYEPLRAPHVAAMTRLSLFLGAVLETRSPSAAAARDLLLRSAFRSPVLGRWLGCGGPRSTASGVLELPARR